MVHVGVRQRHRGRGQGRSGAQADVEDQVQFRDMDHRLLTGNRDALDAERR